MAEQRRASILFSLEGLMEVERHRIEAEAAARRRGLEEARRARQELELARIAARARREEEARFEALRRWLVERVRLEADAHARLELFAQQRQHELRLETIRTDAARARRRQLAFAGLALAGTALAMAIGFYFGKLRPEARRLQLAYDQLVWAERQRAETTEGLLDRAERRREAAEAELARVERELEAARRAAQSDSTRSAPCAVMQPSM